MKLTVREKRVLAVGAVAVIAILIFYIFTSVAPNQEKLAADVEFKKRMLLKQREILLLEDVYIKQVEQRNRILDRTRERLLPGDNASVAGAELQKALIEFAAQSGVEITQKNTLPEKPLADNDMLTKVSVRIETSCNLDQLVGFLTAIENYDKFLKVEELIINSFRGQRKYEIRPSLTISGYIAARSMESQAKAAVQTAGIGRTTASAKQAPEQ